MVTQELKDLAHWHWRHSFWLNRKGRIDADLRITLLDDHLRFDVDVHAAARTIATLQSYVFAEDIAFEDASERCHRLALHGPTSILLMSSIAEPAGGPPVTELRHGASCAVRIAGHEVHVDRDDSCAEIGLELTCAGTDAEEVYSALLQAGAGPDDGDPGGLAGLARLRPAGWHAFNIARIEAGTPLYNIDFSEANLPHETGVLLDRVSFKKGCYLGQEIVARMQSLGHPKQRLVALRLDGEDQPELPQPVSGAEVFAGEDAEKACGHVTSSTISPMLGSAPVCFAMVRFADSNPGARLSLTAEGVRIGATVQESLAFYRRNP
jgi:folate-binding protein YgfZ